MSADQEVGQHMLTPGHLMPALRAGDMKLLAAPWSLPPLPSPLQVEVPGSSRHLEGPLRHIVVELDTQATQKVVKVRRRGVKVHGKFGVDYCADDGRSGLHRL